MMLSWIENLCVLLIVGTAAAYLWTYLARIVRPAKSGGGCGGGCPKCGPKG